MNGVSLIRICKDCGIKVSLLKDAEKLSGIDFHSKSKGGGFAMMIGDMPLILIDDSRPRHEQRYTVAHELGHILLGHLSFRQEYGKLPEFAEEEAGIFASVLLANELICRYGAGAAQ